MDLTSARQRVVGESWRVAAGVVLAAVLLGPVLADLTRLVVDVLDIHFGLFYYAVFSVALGFVAAEAGSGLLASWFVGVPYILFAKRIFSCAGYCPPPPSTLEVLVSVAVPVAVLAGTVGYGGSALLSRWGRTPPLWVSAPVALIAAVSVVILLGLIGIVVHNIVPWHPILDAVLEPLGH